MRISIVAGAVRKSDDLDLVADRPSPDAKHRLGTAVGHDLPTMTPVEAISDDLWVACRS
jgi:hypothetical protein